MMVRRLVGTHILCLVSAILLVPASASAQAEPPWLPAEDTARDIKVQQGQARGVETDELLILINRDMALALDRRTFQLRGLFDPATNKEFISITDKSPAVDILGGVTLLTKNHDHLRSGPTNRIILEAIGFDKARRSHEWRKTDQGIELILSWQGAGAPGEPGTLDVVATVSLGSTGMSRWSCRMENRSKELGLRAVKFPVIGPLKAWDEDDPVDFDSLGGPRPTDVSRQRDVRQSFGADSGFLACFEYHTGFPFGYQAYYGRRAGVYYLPEDPEHFWKDMNVRTEADSRTVTFSHTYICVNSHGEQVKEFASTYPVATGVFHGDWYDAARIYRKWAIRQPWCAKGPLAKREDLPDWFKKLDFFQQCSAQNQLAFDNAEVIARQFGRPVAMWTTHWMHYRFDDKYPDYFPPKMGEEEFKKAVARGHTMGLYFLPYINIYLYDLEAPSYTDEVTQAGAKWFSRGLVTDRFKYGDRDLLAVVMCPNTKFWQDKVSEMAKKVIQEYDCDGIYFDQVDSYYRECGDPGHGHPLGGGNSWVKGLRTILRRVRRESMEAGKKIVLLGEFCRERYIGEYDAYYGLHGKEDTRGEFIRRVIYHDYISTFCTRWDGRDRPFVAFLGPFYVFGRTGGPRAFIAYDNWKLPDEKVAYVHYLSDCRQQFGWKYLNLGARLRDAQMLTKLPVIDRGGRGAKPMPAVITSSWQATGNGDDIGCFFMNISEEAQEFKYEIDLSRFALDSVGTYKVKKYTLGNCSVLDERNPGKLSGEDRLESGKLFMIEFSLRK